MCTPAHVQADAALLDTCRATWQLQALATAVKNSGVDATTAATAFANATAGLLQQNNASAAALAIAAAAAFDNNVVAQASAAVSHLCITG